MTSVCSGVTGKSDIDDINEPSAKKIYISMSINVELLVRTDTKFKSPRQRLTLFDPNFNPLYL